MGKITRQPSMNIKLVLGKPDEWGSLMAIALIADNMGDDLPPEVRSLTEMILDFYRAEGYLPFNPVTEEKKT